MKSKFLFVMLAVLLMFELVLAGCPDEDISNSDDGNPFADTSWTGIDNYGDSVTLSFTSSTWTLTTYGSGSYTYSGNVATCNYYGTTVTATISGNNLVLTYDGYTWMTLTKSSGNNNNNNSSSNPFNGTTWSGIDEWGDSVTLSFTSSTWTLTWIDYYDSETSSYTYNGNVATLYYYGSNVTATISGNSLVLVRYGTTWMTLTKGSGSGGTTTGLYMGIIGFNDVLTEQRISLLNSNTRYNFQSFISNLNMEAGTGLFYAVDNGINRLQTATLPDDLTSVSLVTFTDGLDNVSIDLNHQYDTRDAYRDALRNRIASVKIQNLPINAYSIGIRGSDVVDTTAFSDGLAALASNQSNVFEVSNMTDVNTTFADIANSLYSQQGGQSIRLRITGGIDDGTKIRFTFDNVTSAANSNLYIEGTYKRDGTSRSLQNVIYQGLSSSSGTTVSGTVDGVYVTFNFENTSNTSGGNIPTNSIKQWAYVASQATWQRNSEFGGTGDIVVDRKSAVIMLVLDCTSSLGSTGFYQMQNAANSFISTLVNNQQ